MSSIHFTLSVLGGFFMLHILSHPKSKVNRKLPRIKFSLIQISPFVSINVKGIVIHLHHWLNFSIILIISIVASGSIWDSLITKGFLIGGIIQGLSFSDWKYTITKHT